MKAKEFVSILIAFTMPVFSISCTSGPSLPGDSGKYVDDFWEKTVTKCGDSYWYKTGIWLVQAKDFKPTTSVLPVSKVDHDYNNVEWVVETGTQNGTVVRIWNGSRPMTEWKQIDILTPGLESNAMVRVTIQRKNGVVTYNGRTDYNPPRLSCSTMPTQ
jgi:hypothetical protein